MEVEIYPRLPQRRRLPHTLHVPMTNPEEGGTAVVASSQSRAIWKSRWHLEAGHSSTSAPATSPAPQFPRSISRRRLEAASEVGGRGPLAKDGPVFLIASLRASTFSRRSQGRVASRCRRRRPTRTAGRGTHRDGLGRRAEGEGGHRRSWYKDRATHPRHPIQTSFSRQALRHHRPVPSVPSHRRST